MALGAGSIPSSAGTSGTAGGGGVVGHDPRGNGRAGRALRRGLINRSGGSISSEVIGREVAEMNVVGADALEASLRTL